MVRPDHFNALVWKNFFFVQGIDDRVDLTVFFAHKLNHIAAKVSNFFIKIRFGDHVGFDASKMLLDSLKVFVNTLKTPVNTFKTSFNTLETLLGLGGKAIDCIKDFAVRWFAIWFWIIHRYVNHFFVTVV